MHRTSRSLLIAFVAALGLTFSENVRGQVPMPPVPQAVTAPRAITVPINGTVQLKMTSGKKILRAVSEREAIARAQANAADPTSILLTGLTSGVTRITLTGEDNSTEVVDAIVQTDVEFLKTQLTRAVPTANIQLIPSTNGSIILAGHVANAEDIDAILRISNSFVTGAGGTGGEVINALRLGGVMQVQLDVVVARVSRTDLRRFAFNFMNFGDNHVFASTIGGAFNIPSTGITGTFPGNPTITNSVGTPNGVPANLFLGIFTNKQDFFGLLQALKEEDVAKIMAKPSLVTMSGRPASFLDGGEQAVPVPAGLGQVGVQFEEFGTRLNFLPIVLGNGKIHLEVEPEVSNLDAAFGTSINGTVVPGRVTQRIHTTVELEDGQTYVLGGLIQHDVVGTATKVPVLGELPYIGAAFRSESFNDIESELVILVTPHLVDGMACDQVPRVLPGEESRSPDDFELFLEGILEAPRGPRVVHPNKRYLPAFKNGPTASQIPCAAGGDGHCAEPGCRTGPQPLAAPVTTSPAAELPLPASVPAKADGR
jgi:pilus assembly protein CpaC